MFKVWRESKLNQNRNNLIVIDFDHEWDINLVKYAIQNQERNIMPFFHGIAQQIIKVSDLNHFFSCSQFHLKFRSTRKEENLEGKLLFNRVGKFGVDN